MTAFLFISNRMNYVIKKIKLFYLSSVIKLKQKERSCCLTLLML